MATEIKQKEIEQLLDTIKVILTNEKLSKLIVVRTQSPKHLMQHWNNDVKNTYKVEVVIEE